MKDRIVDYVSKWLCLDYCNGAWDYVSHIDGADLSSVTMRNVDKGGKTSFSCTVFWNRDTKKIVKWSFYVESHTGKMGNTDFMLHVKGEGRLPHHLKSALVNTYLKFKNGELLE